MGKTFFYWFLDWLLDRLDEASTWRAIIIFLGIAGVAIKPEIQDLIIMAGVLLFGGAHLGPDQLQFFSKFKPGQVEDIATNESDAEQSEPITSEQRVERFKEQVEQATNRHFKSTVPPAVVVRPPDSVKQPPTSGWNDV